VKSGTIVPANGVHEARPLEGSSTLFFDTSSFVYISQRFKEGHEGDLQKRLIDPESEEEGDRRKQLAKELGKYGNEVEDFVMRTKAGSQLAYEVKWKGSDDVKDNTVEPISKLIAMGLSRDVIAAMSELQRRRQDSISGH
jgi:hypothetical protein